MKNLLRNLGMKIGLPILSLAAMLNTSCPNMNIKPILNVTRSENSLSHSVQVFNAYQPDEEDNDRWLQIFEEKASFELNPYQSYCFKGIIHNDDLLTYPSKETYWVWAEPEKTYNIDFTFPTLP